MYTHQKQITTTGLPLAVAKKVVIMLHGRGATANSMFSLKEHLNLDDAAILGPEATHHSWYPYSFIAPVKQNQPALDSALAMLVELLEDIQAEGISREQIYFIGFSQGACLALEFTARNAARYGGVIAFTGGLVGEELDQSIYKGDFARTPILITTGDPDQHVPLSRVRESVTVLDGLNADVTLEVYKGRPHTILEEEINLANQLILK